MSNEVRLDKLLADKGIGSRSQVKEYIKKGRVIVNGQVIKDAGYKINLQRDQVLLDKQNIQCEQYVYYMLNKPQGCVSATKDNLSQTVLDLLEGVCTKDLFPVGRLDKDTEGLMLITNDGLLSHELLSPKKHVSKTYLAVLNQQLTIADIQALESGIDIGDDKPCLPATIKEISRYPDYSCEITITEGRYHQIKRMFQKRGYTVMFLKRLSMGELILDPSLKPGQFRKLTEEEMNCVKGYSCSHI